MKFRRATTLLFALLVITAHRLPAPILEEPSPAPNFAEKSSRNATPKPKRKANDSDQAKSNRSPFASFEGTWSGSITSTATATFLFSSTGSSSATVTIRVSKTGVVTYATEQPVQGSVSADGRTLSWNIQKPIDEMTWHQTCSLQLVGVKVANYSDRTKVDGAIADVSGNGRGTLYRR